MMSSSKYLSNSKGLVHLLGSILFSDMPWLVSDLNSFLMTALFHLIFSSREISNNVCFCISGCLLDHLLATFSSGEGW